MAEKDTLRIGDLAGATGTKVVTIRYYEKIGLLPEPDRSAGNYRIYTKGHRERLHFIRRCRHLGFTLEQIRSLLDLSQKEDRDCEAVDRIAVDHLAEIEAKIADLQKLAQELKRVSDCCQGGRIGDCQVIEALSAAGPDVTAA